MADVTLDSKGKKCPIPVILAKKMLKTMNSGQILELISDDPGALTDIPALLSKTGDELLDTKQEASDITFMIKKS